MVFLTDLKYFLFFQNLIEEEVTLYFYFYFHFYFYFDTAADSDE